MIVSEFIEWLKTQDQGASVRVVQISFGHGYNGDSIEQVDFDADPVQGTFTYTDLHNTPLSRFYEDGKGRFLFLGNM